MSISAFGAVDSVQLFTSVPLPEVRRIALTEKSATSICLLKVLCREWGIAPVFGPRLGSLAEVFAGFDGVLLIGDEALYVLRAGVYPYHYDLGDEWRTVTSLPMVFAVCAARREFVEGRRSRRRPWARPCWQPRPLRRGPRGTAADAAQLYDFSQAYLMEYFDKLKFGFTPHYRDGLREFYRRAALLGELAQVPDIPAAAALVP